MGIFSKSNTSKVHLTILEQIKDEPVECAILKSRSPTCGVKQVYDGTFSGRLIDGMGVLAEALQKAGYQVAIPKISEFFLRKSLQMI